MLVQLNRREHRPFTVTATDLPLGPATPTPPPVVAVLGSPSRVGGLSAHLPAGWTVRMAEDLDDVRPDEVVLLGGAGVTAVRTARAVLPRRTRIVALLDPGAPAELVAGVLTAGADACVRGGQPAILASHLVACRRRQLSERWAAVAG
jgi:hypothetical protein